MIKIRRMMIRKIRLEMENLILMTVFLSQYNLQLVVKVNNYKIKVKRGVLKVKSRQNKTNQRKQILLIIGINNNHNSVNNRINNLLLDWHHH